MAKIRFLSSGIDVSVSCDVADGERRTLLSIARQHDVPLSFRCEAGECTTCLVHVETHAVGTRLVSPPADQELSLLVAMYRLSPQDIENARKHGISPEVRLACQYIVNDEDLTVFFEPAEG